MVFEIVSNCSMKPGSVSIACSSVKSSSELESLKSKKCRAPETFLLDINKMKAYFH